VTQPLDINAVSAHYGTTKVLEDLSLSVQAGELVSLLGASGCGKTTTLRLIAGFLSPTSGSISLGGRDLTRLPTHKRDIGLVFQNYALFPHLSVLDNVAFGLKQRGIGFVFQNYALFPHLSVAENVAYGLQVRALSAAEIAERVSEVLKLVGLTGYEHQFSSQLSGGEQQRVALARAIVIRPRVLLFDEPLSNLDAKLRVQMRTEIRDLQRRLAITTVYVTHDQEEAMAVSDRIAVMSQGSVVQEGTAEDLYYRPRSEFVATFVGRVNLVPARVVAAEGDVATVSALGATLRARVPGGHVRQGAAVRLVLRPEAIEIVPVAGAPLTAVVRSRMFLGEKIEYTLACGNVVLQVVRHSVTGGDRVDEGAHVGLRLVDGALTVLPETDA